MRLLRLHGRHLAAALRIILRPAAFILRVAAILYFFSDTILFRPLVVLQTRAVPLRQCFAIVQTLVAPLLRRFADFQ